MNVLFPFIGDSLGGSYVSSVILIRELIRKNIAVTIVIQETGPLEEYIRSIGVTPLFIEIPFAISQGDRFVIQVCKGLFNFFALRRILKNLQIDIVHTNDIRNHIQWMIASRFFCKHVLHFRTDLKNSISWRLFFSQTEQVIVISDYIKRKIYGPRVSRVYNPIDFFQHNHEFEKAKIYKQLGFDPEKKNKILVGYVGRLEIAKGIGLFLNVASECVEEIFIVAGAGSCEHMLRENKVHHIGFVSNVSALLAGLDIIILPSFSEGFGRVLIEAAMQGCRIVASDIPAHREASLSVRNCKFFKVGSDLDCAAQVLSCIKEMRLGYLRDNRADPQLFDPRYHAESILDIYRRT